MNFANKKEYKTTVNMTVSSIFKPSDILKEYEEKGMIVKAIFNLNPFDHNKRHVIIEYLDYKYLKNDEKGTHTTKVSALESPRKTENTAAVTSTSTIPDPYHEVEDDNRYHHHNRHNCHNRKNSDINAALDYQRLFCELPLNDDDESKREDAFFDHFAQFGVLDYCVVKKDRYGRSSIGFVRYADEECARRALKNCDPIYNVDYAKVQRTIALSSADETNENYFLVRHQLCGRDFHPYVYQTHVRTCIRQRQGDILKSNDYDKRDNHDDVNDGVGDSETKNRGTGDSSMARTVTSAAKITAETNNEKRQMGRGRGGYQCVERCIAALAIKKKVM